MLTNPINNLLNSIRQNRSIFGLVMSSSRMTSIDQHTQHTVKIMFNHFPSAPAGSPARATTTTKNHNKHHVHYASPPPPFYRHHSGAPLLIMFHHIDCRRRDSIRPDDDQFAIRYRRIYIVHIFQ